MNTPREEIYAALFAELQALLPSLTTVSRRLKHIEDVQPAEFPCAYQVQQDELASAKHKMPTIWTFRAEWWVYVYEPDVNNAPSSKINPVLDIVTTALDPKSPHQLQMLGGRVYNATIDGTIEVIEGVLGDRALAIIPIRITKAD